MLLGGARLVPLGPSLGARIAQLVERWTDGWQVVGSMLSRSGGIISFTGVHFCDGSNTVSVPPSLYHSDT